MTRLGELSRCFQGVVPCIVVTSDGRGVPNVTYVSQVYYLDDEHVALSCQFFNKTRRNLDENPLAFVEVMEPLTLQTWRLRLRFLRSEKSGPLFDKMALRIEAIASHTGMSGVFKLIAADVFHVESFEKNEGFLTESPAGDAEQVSVDGVRSEVRGLQYISDRINRAECLDKLLDAVLEALDKYFGFEHTMVLLPEDNGRRLVTMASRGYGESGVGAEVAMGQGLIGTVAREKRLLCISGLEAEMRYGRTIRRESGAVTPEVPLPGLCDAQSALVIPLTIGDRLVGVIAAEDRDPIRFGEWHEAYLEIIANQIALGIDRMLEASDDADEVAVPTQDSALSTQHSGLAGSPHGDLLQERRLRLRRRRVPDPQRAGPHPLEAAARLGARRPHGVLEPRAAPRPGTRPPAHQRQSREPPDPAPAPPR